MIYPYLQDDGGKGVQSCSLSLSDPISAESEGERILKIGQHFPKLWARIKVGVFFLNRVLYIHISYLLSLPKFSIKNTVQNALKFIKQVFTDRRALLNSRAQNSYLIGLPCV